MLFDCSRGTGRYRPLFGTLHCPAPDRCCLLRRKKSAHIWVIFHLIKASHVQCGRPYCYSEPSALRGVMTRWFITDAVENMSAATGNGAVQMGISLTDTTSAASRQRPAHWEALWSHFLVWGAAEWEAFININAYFIKLMHIKPAQ